MPTTLRNTDILFNDSTTQIRSAYPAFTVGAVLFATASIATSSASFQLGTIGVALVAGTFRVRFIAQGVTQNFPGDNYTPPSTGTSQSEARIFINGVGVGTAISSPVGSNSAVSQQDFSVAVGDVIQIGVRRIGGNVTAVAAGINAQFGCGAITQAVSLLRGIGNSTFSI